MKIFEEIVDALPDGRLVDICIGSYWTAVVAESDGEIRCGLASIVQEDRQYEENVRTGLLRQYVANAKGLCGLAGGADPLLSSVGLACINALLPPRPQLWIESNAGEIIAQKGSGKRVALIGHFPFVQDLRGQVGELNVLELHPHDGDLPASFAPEVIPQADVVAITGMTFVNGTFEGLLDLCSPGAWVIVLGPSTPLCPILFDYGVDQLCGSFVEVIDPVVEGVRAGKGFRQIHPLGVRLVTIAQSQ